MAGIVQQKGKPSGTGVVFSSGFFGFFAHAGFLSAIRELGITPIGYAGASSGAILAAMAATSMSDPDIKETLFNVKKSHFWDPDPLPVILKKVLRRLKGYTGYLRGEGFSKLLEKIPAKFIEDCPVPLIIVSTNLTLRREEVFTRGPLIQAIQASGSVPMLFKPVEIGGSLFVDGGMVSKAPVEALADEVRPDKIIVHFIASDNIGDRKNSFLNRGLTPWHIQHLAVNISRHEAYLRQCKRVRERGIEVVEVITNAPAVGPSKLERGPEAYEKAREETLTVLSK
jgi:NTE family protein